jgi:hypothetical protein
MGCSAWVDGWMVSRASVLSDSVSHVPILRVGGNLSQVLLYSALYRAF